jgi:hypothetical protein
MNKGRKMTATAQINPVFRPVATHTPFRDRLNLLGCQCDGRRWRAFFVSGHAIKDSLSFAGLGLPANSPTQSLAWTCPFYRFTTRTIWSVSGSGGQASASLRINSAWRFTGSSRNKMANGYKSLQPSRRGPRKQKIAVNRSSRRHLAKEATSSTPSAPQQRRR